MKRKAHKASDSEVYSLLFTADQEQRRDIASKLFNSTSQKLAALRINLRAIERSWGDQSLTIRKAMSECFTLAEQCHDELRVCSQSLYPPMLDEFGLIVALKNYATEVKRQNGFRLSISGEPLLKERRLSKPLEFTLFRIAEDAVHSLRNHFECTFARLELITHERIRHVVLKVSGHRSSPTSITGRKRVSQSAIRGLSHSVGRVRQMGGEVDVQIMVRETVITASIPLAETVMDRRGRASAASASRSS